MRQATHQKHGQSPGVNNGGQMNGNMMQQQQQSVTGQMLGMDQQLQQQHMQQQQATYDVLDNAGYCSPGEFEGRVCGEKDILLTGILFLSQVNNRRTCR